jgi:hypothetical protein
MPNQLSKATREEIVSRVLIHAYAEKEKALVKAKGAFGLRLLRDFFLVGLCETIDTIPEGFLPKITSYHVETFKRRRVDLVGAQRIPYKMGENATCPFLGRLPPASSWYSELEGLVDQEEALKREREQTKAEALGVLESCRTKKKAREAWPELLTLCPGILSDDPVGVAVRSVVVSTSLNERVGLPVVKTWPPKD